MIFVTPKSGETSLPLSCSMTIYSEVNVEHPMNEIVTKGNIVFVQSTTGNERLARRASRGGSAMSIHDREHQLSSERPPATAALVVPLQALDRTLIPLVGGKAANLGELTHAGFPVPDGFCVTTAAYALLSDGAGLEPTLAELASTRVQETVRLAELAVAARSALLRAPFPASCVKAISGTYLELSDGALLSVAVRSSATTEDLPEASFAGQQETFLNIVGVEARSEEHTSELQSPSFI